jgi:hypothetical protein
MATPGKRTMTLNLTEAEMEALEALSLEKDMSKTALLRQALRLFQWVEEGRKAGEKLYLVDGQTKEKKEVMVL